MPRKKRHPTKKPVFVFDLNADTGKAEVKELGVVQELEENQTRFSLLSGDLTRAVKKLLGRSKPNRRPGA